MSKEMNKLMAKVTKYDMICGLFMYLIIGVVLSREIALALVLGILVAMVNYIVSVYATTKWLTKKPFKMLITTILKIFFATICAIPFAYNFEPILAYLLGFTLHFILLGYCITSEKGSD